jgi:hypothetical protein
MLEERRRSRPGCEPVIGSSQRPRRDPQSSPRRRHATLACAVYLTFALITTWPVARGIGTVLPGFPGDSLNCVWAVDTFWSALTAGQNPFETRRVFYPIGANLMHAGGAPTVAIFAGPFWSWGGTRGIVAFFGLLPIALIAIGGLGMRACVWMLTRNARAAFWAGLYFAGAPAILSFIGSPFYFRTAGGVMLPWGLAALLGLMDAPKRTRHLLALSMVTWVLLFTDYYMLFSFLVLVVIVGLVNLRHELTRPILAGLALNGVLAAFVIHLLPPLDPSNFTVGDSFWALCNSNLGDLFVPGSLPEQAAAQYFPGVLSGLKVYATDWGPNPSSYFIGYGILVLIVVALLRRLDRPLVGLCLTTIVLVLLSCGTAIQWERGGAMLAQEQWTPFYWVARVPWLQVFDNPRCFMLGAATPIVAMAGVGLASLRWRPGVIHALALGIFLLDYAQVGIPVNTPTVPRVYEELAAMPTATLLELPSGVDESKGGLGLNFDQTDNNEAMYWQTIHRKPRVAGYMSRVPQATFEWFFHEPVIGDLLLLTMVGSQWTCYHGETRVVERLPDYPPDVVDQFVREFDLGYVIFRPGSRQRFFMAEVDRLLGSRITRREMIDGYALFTVAPRAPD